MLEEKTFVPYDHQHPKRWFDLTQEEKGRVLNKTTSILTATMQNPNKLVPYDYLNRCGLEHLYHFLVNSWNDTHAGKILVLEKGIKYVP